MAPTGPDFVRRAMAHLNVTSAAGLAEKMRWKRGTERLVAKWLADQNDPSYVYTMELLERCGWLNMDGVAEAGSDQAGPGDPLAALAATGEALLQGQEAILEAVRALVRPAETAEQPQAASKAKPR